MRPAGRVYLLALISFLAAFLLFQLELIVAKLLLPNYGGSFQVWGASVVFFQFVLLAGYAYTHFVVRRFGIPRYGPFHMAVILLPLVTFPGRPLAAFLFHERIPLVFDVFLNLATGIGAVFFVLSTVSVILQAWTASSDLPEKSNPYILYGVSNFGSLLALVTYPFLAEVFLDTHQQLLLWRIGYMLLAAAYLVALAIIRTSAPAKAPGTPVAAKPGITTALYWFLLGSAGSAASLSVTNILTYQILPGPFLWIIPLCIYLLSFVLVFKARPWCPQWVIAKPHIMFASAIAVFLMGQKSMLPVIVSVLCFFWVLFVACMFCQKKLYEARPQDPQGLTGYYLAISLGGVCGSILVTWVAPLLFTTMAEFLLFPLMIALAMFMRQEKKGAWDPVAIRFAVYLAVFVYAWGTFFPENWYNVFAVALLCLTAAAAFKRMARDPKMLMAGLVAVIMIADNPAVMQPKYPPVYTQRNYYSTYSILLKNGVEYLMHGSIMHGAQYIDEEKRYMPLVYFHADTPIGVLLRSDRLDFTRTGVIGLGAGALAAYGRPGMTMDFYELDPDIHFIASTFFSHLKDSRAKLNFIMGDARLEIAKQPPKKYQALVVDAFNGDSIPTHLLTREAFKEYRRVLDDKGVLVFHASNGYLRLGTLLMRNAMDAGAYSFVVINHPQAGKPAETNYLALWVMVTWDKDTYETLKEIEYPNGRVRGPDPRVLMRMRPWTDSYVNLLSVFMGRQMLDSIKSFKPFSW